ncbi:hypothetical protein HDU84_007036 [Entophlyctis sp. JEL0112]|nr:hypothetical protein HDU84_007036 [Entophlyctis sp. JEL0112]
MSENGDDFDFNDDDDENVDDDVDDVMMADDADDDDELFGLAMPSSAAATAAATAPATRPPPHQRARRLDSASTDVSVASASATKSRRTYRVPAASVDPRGIRDRMDTACRNISELVGVDSDAAARLLAVFKWDADTLIDAVFGNPSQKLSLLLARSQLKPKPVSLAECPICYDVDCAGFELGCAHACCSDCLRTYLVQKISEEGESFNIQCPDSSCDFTIGESAVKILVNSKSYEKYQALQMRSYVGALSWLKWCPHPNCELAVECKVSAATFDEVVPSVECANGHDFCFGANTKECEKCQSTIEKNGGCNHMTCRKCKYEFCWVCMGPWSDHGTQWYNCNRFEEKASIDARDHQAKSRQALERYLHQYFNRYANHEQSAKLDKELSEKISKKMLEMQKNSEMSWIEVQFLSTAKTILLASRNTLKWTYCFAFYLTRNNSALLFEDNQRDLEMAVEQLSELLERQFEPVKLASLKQAILDKSVYVAQRREVLLAATATDLLDARLVWSIENSSDTLSLAVQPGKK